MIIGGKVDEGEIRKNKPVAIWRKYIVPADGEGTEETTELREVGRGEIVELQQSKVDTKEVTRGNEFGMKIKTTVKLQEGDTIESFEETLKQKTL
jgi:translation initiation factor IF-2